MNYLVTSSFSLLLFLLACSSPHSEQVKLISKQDEINNYIASLKERIISGDLVVRMTDDLISEQIKFINEKEKIYSHAGIAILKNGHLLICNIAPNDPMNDTIQFVPVDTFINPSKNLKCALYRYDLSRPEKNSLTEIMLKYKANDVRFDWVYDLDTDRKMYCAELIYKALKKATYNKIVIRQTNIPVAMQPTVLSFLKKSMLQKKLLHREKLSLLIISTFEKTVN
ncbi:MAG: YiiX/YebB-like N1pC/P60 family cysteine hydrolase [Ginsengibacter sp.]